MNFGEILDQWDKKAGPVYNKDADSASTASGLSEKQISAARRKRLLRKNPEATIDLHGLTRDEAWNALTAFFNDAKNSSLEKVLIIHGKGNHSSTGGPDSGILKKIVRDFIETCPFAGESGYSDGRSGGDGSSWVLLKGR